MLSYLLLFFIKHIGTRPEPSHAIQFKTNPQKKKARDMIFGVYAFKQPVRGGTTLITNQTSTSDQYKDSVDYRLLEHFFWQWSRRYSIEENRMGILFRLILIFTIIVLFRVILRIVDIIVKDY